MHTLPGVLLCFSFDGHELRRPIDADWSPEIPGACRNLPVHPCRRMRLIFPLENRHFCAEIPAHDLLIILQNPVFFKSAIPHFRKNCAKTGHFLKQLTEKRNQIAQYSPDKTPGRVYIAPRRPISGNSRLRVHPSRPSKSENARQRGIRLHRRTFPFFDCKSIRIFTAYFSTMLSAPMRFASAPKS